MEIEVVVVLGVILSIILIVGVEMILRVRNVHNINDGISLHLKKGNVEEIKTLLKKLTTSGTIDGKNEKGLNFLQQAAILNYPEIIKVFATPIVHPEGEELTPQVAQQTLKQRGIEIDAKDENGWSALHHAVSEGNYEASKQLLELGAAINLQNNEGWTALHIACYRTRHFIKELLVQHGADEMIKTYVGQTAFSIQEEIVKYRILRK